MCRNIWGLFEMGEQSCELCVLENRTEWFYEDDYFVVCECETCNCLMIVLKRHTTELTLKEKQMFYTLVNKFGQGTVLDEKRRTIKNHFHAHLRN